MGIGAKIVWTLGCLTVGAAGGIGALLLIEQKAKPVPPSVDHRIADAMAAVRFVLKDPASAYFEDTYLTESGDRAYVCGAVNSKNSMGGYVGSKRFLLDIRDNAVMLETNENQGAFYQDWKDYCENAPVMARAPNTPASVPSLK